MMNVPDQTIFAAFEEAEKRYPAQFKLDGDRRVYCSRGLDTPDYMDLPILTDFGNAHIDNGHNVDNVQPWQYRAPEVVLRMSWSYEIDIWNVGMLVRLIAIRIRYFSLANESRFGTYSRTRQCSRVLTREQVSAQTKLI